MNYADHYEALVAKAKARNLQKGERHHITPKCLGGSEDKENLVMFSPREHFFAHLLLLKIHPTVCGLSYAVVMMAGNKFRNLKTSRQYEWARKLASAHRSKNQKGWTRNVGPMLAAARVAGKSEEHRRKISETLRGRKIKEETKEKIRATMKLKGAPQNFIAAGRKQAEEMRGKPNLRAVGNKYRLGCVNSPEHRAATGAGHRGKKHSAQWSENQARGLTRITDHMALAIRSEYPELSQQKIADKFGVSQTHVSRIIRGQTHRWLWAA